MSYTGSKAQVGRGTIVAIGPVAPGSGTPTFVPIYEIKKIGIKNSWDKTETSNFNSGIFKEYAQTMIDGGAVTISGNRVSGDPGQAAAYAAFLAGGAYLFKVTYPLAPGQTTTGDVESFTALVMSFGRDIDVASDMQLSIDLQITYADTLVVGS